VLEHRERARRHSLLLNALLVEVLVPAAAPERQATE
jgi:hypothetical protein